METVGRKWVNGVVAVAAILLGYYIIAFLGQLSEWMDLESKINYFNGLKQVVGLVSGLLFFLFIHKNSKYMTFLDEVYAELVKVVWPDRDSVIKLTIGIVVALGICSVVFFVIDYLSQTLLSFLY